MRVRKYFKKDQNKTQLKSIVMRNSFRSKKKYAKVKEERRTIKGSFKTFGIKRNTQNIAENGG